MSEQSKRVLRRVSRALILIQVYSTSGLARREITRVKLENVSRASAQLSFDGKSSGGGRGEIRGWKFDNIFVVFV